MQQSLVTPHNPLDLFFFPFTVVTFENTVWSQLGSHKVINWELSSWGVTQRQSSMPGLQCWVFPREVMVRRPQRPCVTTVHRHLVPVVSKGAGHLVALVCLELRIWQDLARQKGLNVRSANGACIQQEGNLVGTVDEAGEAASTSPRVPGSWESLPFVFKGVPPWLLPCKPGAKDVRSSTVHRLCALTVTHCHLAVTALSYPGGDPTQLVGCGNDLQTWYRGLFLLRGLFCIPYIC